MEVVRPAGAAGAVSVAALIVVAAVSVEVDVGSVEGVEEGTETEADLATVEASEVAEVVAASEEVAMTLHPQEVGVVIGLCLLIEVGLAYHI